MKKNLENILHSGDGFYPYKFFMENESYIFTEWSYNEDDNKRLMDKLVNLIRESGHEIFVRDWSFLSFPTYQIVSPGFSNLYDSLDERIEWHKNYIDARKYSKKLGEISKYEFDKILKFMNDNGYTNVQGIMNIVGLPLDLNGKWAKLKKDYFIALYYYKNQEYEKAYKSINSYVNSYNNVISRCLRHYILLKYLKKSDEKILAELSNLYNKDIVVYIENGLNKENIFKEYNINCIDCEECMETECYQKTINILYKKIKNRYSEYYTSLK